MSLSQTAALHGDLGINTQKCLKEQGVLHQAETNDSSCSSWENSASFEFRFLQNFLSFCDVSYSCDTLVLRK